MADRRPPPRFDIVPHVGALPITFGMRRDEVHRLLGPPEVSTPIWDGSGTSDSYSQAQYNVGYDNSGVVDHIGFGPGEFELTIQGRVIWTPSHQPDPNPILLALEPEPVEYVGFWAFLILGVMTGGYHDGDRSQRALAVFPRTPRAAAIWAQAKPADTSRYRS